MSADHQVMDLQRIVHHVADKTIELTLYSREPGPPPPSWIRPDHWYGGETDIVTITLPVGKRIPATVYTRVGLIGQDGDGVDIYLRYTWDAQKQDWIAGPRVDPRTWQPL